jgi:hypothetical protein
MLALQRHPRKLDGQELRREPLQRGAGPPAHPHHTRLQQPTFLFLDVRHNHDLFLRHIHRATLRRQPAAEALPVRRSAGRYRDGHLVTPLAVPVPADRCDDCRHCDADLRDVFQPGAASDVLRVPNENRVPDRHHLHPGAVRPTASESRRDIRWDAGLGAHAPWPPVIIYA